MSKEILCKINREKGGLFSKSYVYGVDKEGNVFKKPYNLLEDPYTLVTICVILMGLLYYTSILNNPLAVKNIDHTCESLADVCGRYLPLKDKWIEEHPGEELNVRAIINTKVYDDTGKQNIPDYSSLNLSLIQNE